jgi:hypothetical protein
VALTSLGMTGKRRVQDKIFCLGLRGFSHYSRESIADFIAKNLESHQVSCFKIGFSKGFRKCRFFVWPSTKIFNVIFRDKQFVPWN